MHVSKNNSRCMYKIKINENVPVIETCTEEKDLGIDLHFQRLAAKTSQVGGI